jgi:hypothetical protein
MVNVAPEAPWRYPGSIDLVSNPNRFCLNKRQIHPPLTKNITCTAFRRPQSRRFPRFFLSNQPARPLSIQVARPLRCIERAARLGFRPPFAALVREMHSGEGRSTGVQPELGERRKVDLIYVWRNCPRSNERALRRRPEPRRGKIPGGHCTVCRAQTPPVLRSANRARAVPQGAANTL